MDRLKLSRIDEELESSEVAALCFLCCDVVSRKRLERIGDAKQLFLRLEEKGLLDNPVFLSQLLHTIRRADLLNLLETDSRQPEETDASPVLSTYRVMLYRIYEDMTEENLKNMKFLLNGKLGRRQIEASDTALDLFAEMEKAGLLSDTDVNELLATLREFDQQLALTVQLYKNKLPQQEQERLPPHFSMDNQPSVNNNSQPTQPTLSISETIYEGESVHTDAEISRETSSLPNEDYALTHIPRGLCVVINNESFRGLELSNRGGTQEDAKALRKVFYSLGFDVVIHDNLTADDMRHKLKELSRRNYSNEDALVVCVLSHGEQGCVFGTDEKKVSLRELTEPFTSKIAPTLTGKPKLFFIQACQGSGYQGGTVPCPPRPRNEEEVGETFEEDAGPVYGETVPWDADFLLGMATVQECKSFRNTSTGSIYIQELCKQLTRSAESSERDNILDVLTRVNREVGRGVYLSRKQMPEPKYTLTKRLVLKFVR
ncbi:caspase-8 isoform X2 [Lates calcarifer]|uniref:Caspase-8 n=1 Tax=Lates calcarifer TaxID=8187 RepID=A0AAJ7PMX2_LATCA|nr:caspase-8 isoform X2 [Lates calcarifer]